MGAFRKGTPIRSDKNGAANVWEQSLTGGPPQQIAKFTSGIIFDFVWSRDRKLLVLAKGNRTSDVILIGNFKIGNFR